MYPNFPCVVVIVTAVFYYFRCRFSVKLGTLDHACEVRHNVVLTDYHQTSRITVDTFHWIQPDALHGKELHLPSSTEVLKKKTEKAKQKQEV